MRNRITERVKKPTPLEELTLATVQDHRHLSTTEVTSRRDSLQKDLERLDAEVVRSTTAVVEAKEARARTTAVIAGLTLVIDRR